MKYGKRLFANKYIYPYYFCYGIFGHLRKMNNYIEGIPIGANLTYFFPFINGEKINYEGFSFFAMSTYANVSFKFGIFSEFQNFPKKLILFQQWNSPYNPTTEEYKFNNNYKLYKFRKYFFAIYRNIPDSGNNYLLFSVGNKFYESYRYIGDAFNDYNNNNFNNNLFTNIILNCPNIFLY